MRNILSTASPGGAHSVKSRNGRRLGLVSVLLGVVAAGVTGVAYAERSPGGLPAAAPEADLKFQPATDYDMDGCYPTPAIGPDGTINPGKDLGGDQNGECRDEVDLDDANVYSRSKCNNGWCAYMYAYYFEKDQPASGGGVVGPAGGHKHDWEHVVVWVPEGGDTPEWVAVSHHTEYLWIHRDQIQWHDGTHAKVVYHLDAPFTHAFRHAKSDGGDEPPENHKGTWHLPKVIGWDYFPPGFRDTLVAADFGDATLALKDGKFEENLEKAKPSEVSFDPRG